MMVAHHKTTPISSITEQTGSKSALSMTVKHLDQEHRTMTQVRDKKMVALSGVQCSHSSLEYRGLKPTDVSYGAVQSDCKEPCYTIICIYNITDGFCLAVH